MPPTVVAVVVSVAQIALAAKTAQDKKKAARRQAELNKKATDNRQDQRKADEARNKVLLAKETRAKRAEVLNISSQDGTLTSTVFNNAFNAIQQNQDSSFNFLNQKSALSDIADEITKEQIDADAAAKIDNANNQFLSDSLSTFGNFKGL